MTTDLQQYIETQILPTAGIVEEPGEPITTLQAMREWINANLHIQLPISVQNLSEYLLLDNDGIIQKKRSIYVNMIDFYDLDLPILGDDHTNQHKEILNVVIIPVFDVEPSEFYYCTDDEWQILKAE